MISTLISFILIIIASVSNALMDVLSYRYERSIFANAKNQQFYNPAISWKNKYLNHDPEQGKAFVGSTTFLVGFTDAWHLAKTIMLLCFISAIVIGFGLGAWSLFLIPLLYMVYGTVFELCWNIIFIKKKKNESI